MLTRMTKRDKTNWDEMLPMALLSYQSTTQKTTKFSPAELLYGKQLRLPSQYEFPTIKAKMQDHVHYQELQDRITRLKTEVERNIKKIQDKNKENQERYKQNNLEIGDLVLCHITKLDKQWSNKLANKWDRPYIIQEKLDKGAYQLKTLEGNIETKWTNGSRLKVYKEAPFYVY